MKRLLLVLAILLTAGSVFAAELAITGDAMVRGTSKTYEVDAPGADAETAMYFDYDFNLNMALKANENATVFMRLTYDKNVAGSGKVADGNGGLVGTTAGQPTFTGDPTVPAELMDPTNYYFEEDYDGSFLGLERAYINYKFAPFLQLNTGLMGGGQWATAFGDNEINIMRVQFIGALSKDMIFIATYQKDDENGIGTTNAVADKESQENTTYYLSGIFRSGELAFKPLLTYRTIGKGFVDPITLYALTLGVDGNFGMIGMEAEFVYTSVDLDTKIKKNNAELKNVFAGEDSVTAYGAYINVWANLDFGKVGAAGAYTSSDKKTEAALTYGGDFDFTMIVDDMYWGSEDGLPGFMSGKIWAEVPVSEKLTLSALVAYGQATDKKAGKYNATLDDFLAEKLLASALPFDIEDVEGGKSAYIGADLSYWEVNAAATYAFDANTAYKIEVGYASMDNGDAKTTDTAYVVRHRMTVKF